MCIKGANGTSPPLACASFDGPPARANHVQHRLPPLWAGRAQADTCMPGQRLLFSRSRLSFFLVFRVARPCHLPALNEHPFASPILRPPRIGTCVYVIFTLSKMPVVDMMSAGEICLPRICGRYMPPENGRVWPRIDVSYNETVNISCNRGYKLEGHGSSVPRCLADGTFEIGRL